MDPRRRRTRLRLQVALRQLLAEKRLAEISVEELSRRAGVTRPTFYSNYADLAAMLDDYLTGLLAEIESRHEAIIHATGCEGRAEALGQIVTATFADLDRDDPRLHALLGGVPSLLPEARFADLVARMMEQADPGEPPLNDHDRALAAHYYTGAFLGLVRYWIGRPPGLDAEAMGRAFTDLTLHGRRGAAEAMTEPKP